MSLNLDLRPLGGSFRARSENQSKFVGNILTNFVSFGIGAAGSGKTYVAVATAVHLLATKQVDKLIFTRPIVEAGESLGFLPGTIEEKIAPYLFPFYDSLDSLIGKQKRVILIEDGSIEILPLAFMRGRTLSDSVIILDEAQNATLMQVKMLLTRIGKRSRVIVNGDISQNDLRRDQMSGLADAVKRLDGIKGIATVNFSTDDVVRHKIVKEIIMAYENDPT